MLLHFHSVKKFKTLLLPPSLLIQHSKAFHHFHLPVKTEAPISENPWSPSERIPIMTGGLQLILSFFAIKFMGLWIELDLQFRGDLKHSCGVDGFLGNALHGNSASTSTDLCSAWRSSSNFTKNQACWWKASGLQRKWGPQEQIKVQDHHSSWLWELQRNEFPCTPSTHLNLSNLNHSLVFILKCLQIKLSL